MLEKNQIISAVTEGLGSNGEGIVRHEGITFFRALLFTRGKNSFPCPQNQR